MAANFVGYKQITHIKLLLGDMCEDKENKMQLFNFGAFWLSK